MEDEEGGGVEGEGKKWATHYCSDHQILLVGEGDFSFSLSLANSFGSAANILASSLDSFDDVTKKYKNAKSNLDDLQKLGACLLHGVDATKMKLHSDLKMRRFDRIIFNFPHAGFHRKEDNPLMIKMHKDLVLGFFKNASCMLRANGEIHVNHKCTAPFSDWNIEKLAMQSFLALIECADFKIEDYPGYNNKRGDSYRCDEPFPLGKCSTFKFVFNPRAKGKRSRRNRKVVSRQQTKLPFQETRDAMEQLPTPLYLNYCPQTSHIPKINEAMTSTRANHSFFSDRWLELDRWLEHHLGSNFIDRSSRDHHKLLTNYYGPFTERSIQDSIEQLPTPGDLNYYPQTNHIPKMNEVVTSPRANRSFFFDKWLALHRVSNHAERFTRDQKLLNFGLTKGYPPISDAYLNNVAEIQGRTAPGMSLSSQRSFQPLQPMESLQLQQWQTSTNVRYSQTDHVRRMDIVPLSLGARNEGYKVFGASSNFLQEAHQRTSYSFDRVRPNFERYIAEVPERNLNGDIYVQSELRQKSFFMSERRKMYDGS